MKQKLPVNLARKDQKRLNKQEPIRNTKAERQLLGELYADKAYLEKLLKDEGLSPLYLTRCHRLFLLTNQVHFYPLYGGWQSFSSGGLN